MPISTKTVRAFTRGIPWAKVFKKAENTTAGQRLYPSYSHDKKKNFQIDNGATISGINRKSFFKQTRMPKSGSEKTRSKGHRKDPGKMHYRP
jgi:hypothetical protein